ncbi:hypothetical protein MP228_007912 [Amoeboaphelidium protococcarum]|nr:hypothetical protein MP228_007912 [Amoeboaphelidium protococcarum]
MFNPLQDVLCPNSSGLKREDCHCAGCKSWQQAQAQLMHSQMQFEQKKKLAVQTRTESMVNRLHSGYQTKPPPPVHRNGPGSGNRGLTRKNALVQISIVPCISGSKVGQFKRLENVGPQMIQIDKYNDNYQSVLAQACALFHYQVEQSSIGQSQIHQIPQFGVDFDVIQWTQNIQLAGCKYTSNKDKVLYLIPLVESNRVQLHPSLKRNYESLQQLNFLNVEDFDYQYGLPDEKMQDKDDFEIVEPTRTLDEPIIQPVKPVKKIKSAQESTIIPVSSNVARNSQIEHKNKFCQFENISKVSPQRVIKNTRSLQGSVVVHVYDYETGSWFTEDPGVVGMPDLAGKTNKGNIKRCYYNGSLVKFFPDLPVVFKCAIDKDDDDYGLHAREILNSVCAQRCFLDFDAELIKTPLGQEYLQVAGEQRGVCAGVMLEIRDKQNEEFGDMVDLAKIWTVEPFVDGQFVKYIDNEHFMQICDDDQTYEENFCEEVAWAFAHYSYYWFEKENYEQMIVDIQGSKCHFTDLQVCTVNGTDCSIGNMGLPAIVKFFVMHQCNQICKALHLDVATIPSLVMEKIMEDSLLMDKFESTVFGSPAQAAPNPLGQQKTSLKSDVSITSVSKQVEVNNQATQDLQIVKEKSKIKLVDPIVKNIRPSSRRPNTRAKNAAQKKLPTLTED